jgi:hypothetical protein
LVPSLTHRQPVADVERDDDPAGSVADEELTHRRRVAKRHGPDDHTRGAGSEGPLDVFGRPQTAGDLAPDGIDRLDDPADPGGLARLPCPGGVEIDDVQPLSALRRPGPRHGDGVVAVARLVGEVTPRKTNDTTVS